MKEHNLRTGETMTYIMTAAAIFAADSVIKRNVDKKRKLGEEKEIFGGKIVLTKYYNKGAALNLLSEKPDIMTLIHTGFWGFLAGIFASALKRKENPGFLTGLALLLGGGASNLFDRIKKKHVVDYFSFGVKWEKFRNIIFNVSDLFIFLGGILSVVFGRRT